MSISVVSPNPPGQALQTNPHPSCHIKPPYTTQGSLTDPHLGANSETLRMKGRGWMGVCWMVVCLELEGSNRHHDGQMG